MANIKKKEKDYKSVVITVRATQEQKERIKKKAEKSKQSVSTYMLEMCLYKRQVNSVREQKRLESLIRTQDALFCLGRSLERYYPINETKEALKYLEEELKKLWDY